MSKVYTKTGDKGTTSLLSGEKVKKYDLRVEAYGSIDEAGVAMGQARAAGAVSSDLLYFLQTRLQALCAELAGGDINRLREPITEEDVLKLEKEIDDREKFLPKRQGFTIPVGNEASGFLHQARTIMRRAERQLCRAAETYPVRQTTASFVNRLSDLLYILACEEEYVATVVSAVKNAIKELQTGGGKDMGLLTNDEKLAPGLPGERISQLSEQLIRDCKKRAKEINVPMAISIVDESGVLCAFDRMPGVLLASIEISQGKAYTAAAFRKPTHELYNDVQPGSSLYGIETLNGGNTIVFGGGYPLMEDGRLIGALGVSGGTVDEDRNVAEYALQQIKEIQE